MLAGHSLERRGQGPGGLPTVGGLHRQYAEGIGGDLLDYSGMYWCVCSRNRDSGQEVDREVRLGHITQ